MDIDVFKDIIGMRIGLSALIRKIVFLEHTFGIVFEVTSRNKLEGELRTGEKLYEKIGLYENSRSLPTDDVLRDFANACNDANDTLGKRISEEQIRVKIKQMMTSGEFDEAIKMNIKFHKPLTVENIDYWTNVVIGLMRCRVEVLRAGYFKSGSTMHYGSRTPVRGIGEILLNAGGAGTSITPDSRIIVIYKCDREWENSSNIWYAYRREDKPFKDGVLCKIFTLLWK